MIPESITTTDTESTEIGKKDFLQQINAPLIPPYSECSVNSVVKIRLME
jgi:hypothetical protein